MMLVIQIADAQKSDSPVAKNNLDKYNYLMKKRNTNNTIGWVCLGTGIGLGVIGGLEGLADATNVSYNTMNNSNAKGTGLFIVGNVVALASIPFFISAHKFKKKASLSLKNESVMIGTHVLYRSNYKALSVNIKL